MAQASPSEIAKIKPVLARIVAGSCGCAKCRGAAAPAPAVPAPPLSWDAIGGDAADSPAADESAVPGPSAPPSFDFFEDALKEMQTLSSSLVQVD